MSVLQKLTEGIVNRNIQKEGEALLQKWEQTGLLEGMDNEGARSNMAVLLENQAKELLREASSMAAGDVEGFASVAFPIVRRVFGGLIANQLVSVQPMSLPAGLIFFLDFTYTNTRAGVLGAPVNSDDPAAQSVYGGGVVGKDLITGVTELTEEGGGFYNLQSGYSSPTGSGVLDFSSSAGTTNTITASIVSDLSDGDKRLLAYDPDLLASPNAVVTQFLFSGVLDSASPSIPGANLEQLVSLSGTPGTGSLVRRLTDYDPLTDTLRVTISDPTASTSDLDTLTGSTMNITYALVDTFNNVGSDALGALRGASPWGLEGAGQQPNSGTFNDSPVDFIPEIDIKVDSVSVTAVTKKLKAKWTPELSQDLNAFHNMDAEVELTSILSEQIALEIDQEILNDLVKGATAGTFYWSRRPGRFVDRGTGLDIESGTNNEGLLGADFTGTVSEWYETLIETINDVSAQIHRKTLRGGANFLVCGPETANILEFTAGFRASVTHDADTGQAGTVKIGAISKKFDVYVDPYFPRNAVLVGRKGASFLESGYVYAPYVPLQVTPTIFGVEDFVPRKGVMTRYAKKMVRPDMYGLVVIKDFLG